MSTLSQFSGGNKPPKTIVNAVSSGGSFSTIAYVNASGAKIILSGGLTAGALKTTLSITGAGILNFLSLSVVDTTSRTIRGKLTLDGVVVFDATSSAITVAGYGLSIIGTGTSTSSGPFSLDEVPFNTSCVFEVASSLSETDTIQTRCIYKTF